MNLAMFTELHNNTMKVFLRSCVQFILKFCIIMCSYVFTPLYTPARMVPYMHRIARILIISFLVYFTEKGSHIYATILFNFYTRMFLFPVLKFTFTITILFILSSRSKRFITIRTYSLYLIHICSSYSNQYM